MKQQLGKHLCLKSLNSLCSSIVVSLTQCSDVDSKTQVTSCDFPMDYAGPAKTQWRWAAHFANATSLFTCYPVQVNVQIIFINVINQNLLYDISFFFFLNSYQLWSKYTIIFQESGQGSWHIPPITRGDFETPRQWDEIRKEEKHQRYNLLE